VPVAMGSTAAVVAEAEEGHGHQTGEAERETQTVGSHRGGVVGRGRGRP
jgi:hypothetical protein